MPQLIYSNSEGTPFVYEFNGKSVTIGRHPENMVVLDDPSVSIHHAEIQVFGSEVWLKDLGSSNGIKVNGVRGKELELRPGDNLQFGEVVVSFW